MTDYYTIIQSESIATKQKRTSLPHNGTDVDR